MGFKKNIFLIILIGFLISSITGLFNLKKYDQISNQPHSMITGDIKFNPTGKIPCQGINV